MACSISHEYITRAKERFVHVATTSCIYKILWVRKVPKMVLYVFVYINISCLDWFTKSETDNNSCLFLAKCIYTQIASSVGSTSSQHYSVSPLLAQWGMLSGYLDYSNRNRYIPMNASCWCLGMNTLFTVCRHLLTCKLHLPGAFPLRRRVTSFREMTINRYNHRHWWLHSIRHRPPGTGC